MGRYCYRGISRSRYYRSHGITVRQIPYPRYYREILPITAVITAVTAVLPLSPFPCHSLVVTRHALPVLWLTSRLAVVSQVSRPITTSGVATPGRSLMSMNALLAMFPCLN